MNEERARYALAKEATREYLLGFISHDQYLKEISDLPMDVVTELPTTVRREAELIVNR